MDAVIEEEGTKLFRFGQRCEESVIKYLFEYEEEKRTGRFA